MGKKNNLVRNASFLMIAAMISKIIGLLYKSPLSSIVGNMGMGYISLAQNAYMILLMIASFSIPQAVSKLISERIALRDYKNAQKIFRGSMIYAAVVGGAVALFCLFGARSPQSAQRSSGFADFIPYHIPFGNSRRVQGIFSGIQKYASHICFSDS